MYQLFKNGLPIGQKAPFDIIWANVLDQYGHFTIRQFHDETLAIVKV